MERFFGSAEKINIIVPGRLFTQIDAHARAHGETRSDFVTEAELEAMTDAGVGDRRLPIRACCHVCGEVERLQVRPPVGLLTSSPALSAPWR